MNHDTLNKVRRDTYNKLHNESSKAWMLKHMKAIDKLREELLAEREAIKQQAKDSDGVA